MTSDRPRPCPRCRRDRAIRAELTGARMCTTCAVALWGSAEPVYRENGYSGPGQPGATRHIPGAADVLFTAPNAVNYFRGSYQHRAARWTGSAVEALAAVTGKAALAMAGPPSQIPCTLTPEPAFAARVTELITPTTFIVDVLGMLDRQVDVCLGLGPLPDARSIAVAEHVTRALTARGVRVATGEPFAGLTPVAVVAYAQVHLSVSALQVAVAAGLRDPDAAPTPALLLLDVLRDVTAHLGTIADVVDQGPKEGSTPTAR
jgi:hypothetical protein